MAAVIMRFQVTDQERWKRMHDTTARERAAVGIRAGLVFADAEDPDRLIVVYQVEDIRRARAYLTMGRHTDREFEAGVSERELWFGVEF